jgi:hypothetical protein
MDKGNVIYINNGVLFSLKEELNYFIFMKMDGTRDHHIKQNKSSSEGSHVFSHIWNLY